MHAAWSASARTTLEPWLDTKGALTDEGLVRAAHLGDPVRRAREVVLNGFETRLPRGLSYVDPDGNERQEVRLRWWRAGEPGLTWRDAALVPNALRERLPDTPLPPGVWETNEDDRHLMIFGHYWTDLPLTPLSPRHVCVDASIAKGGRLACYRFSGEQTIDPAHLVAV